MNQNEYEVIIIGGSYSGLSAAMVLGRSLRKTLIIDSGKPCNRQTPHSHNFLTQDGSTPQEISKIAKTQVLKYDTVTFYEALATGAKKTKKGFEITTSLDTTFKAKKLVFATGIKDLIPKIKGFVDCWAISVVHCPYCHGYEIKNKKTAIITNGEKAVHITPLVHNLTKNSTLITSGKAGFSSEQILKFKQNNIAIIEKEISEIVHTNGQLEKIIFKDGSKENFDCAYAAIPFEQNTTIPMELGCELTEDGHLKVNSMFQTTVNGIYACGDNSTPMRSVANAVYAGNVTGAVINKELADASFNNVKAIKIYN
ncbi:thioredoxin reductase [Maribacter vaceletii]|uniref:Thioredoxin reductase n=1 Tax=Maribacter vaceletii TaxID=1206816 RepID=A0A495EES0_9FLAO|nr:NAD(P)/FAD-dependent oxidoreductase [Maribacter vaceletii]RKR15372.1 thioredoxin reductase [Maribacter vaceletii]